MLKKLIVPSRKPVNVSAGSFGLLQTLPTITNLKNIRFIETLFKRRKILHRQKVFAEHLLVGRNLKCMRFILAMLFRGLYAG